MIIFSVKDPSGRTIRLTNKQWKHIAKEHPCIENFEEFYDTLVRPLKRKASVYDDDVTYYFSRNKKKKRFFMVAVKYLNGDGFIITAFYVRKIR